LTIAVRLILPSWIAFFKTGVTLRSRAAGISKHGNHVGEEREGKPPDLLLGMRGVDDHGILGLVVYD
jgi:hypothetical protein